MLLDSKLRISGKAGAHGTVAVRLAGKSPPYGGFNETVICGKLSMVMLPEWKLGVII